MAFNSAKANSNPLSGWFAICVFVAYVAYLPFHVIEEPHCSAGSTHAAIHHHAHDHGHDHSHSDDHSHRHHTEEEHGSILAGKDGKQDWAPIFVAIAFDRLIEPQFAELIPTESTDALPPDRLRHPDPSRAPPVA